MKKLVGVISILLLVASEGLAQKKLSLVEKQKIQQDKEAIKSMAGCYKVTFEFAETFSSDTAYKYHDRKFDWAIEYAFVLEETDTKVSIQHLLIIPGGVIIKHWRQDWLYENAQLLRYDKDDNWKSITLKPEQAKGTWTQKVFQVDDSPRYEGYGTWVHVDNRHFWESTTDAPLPRREKSIRDDYNVLKRFSHVEITNYGWVLEQDNEKILRENGTDKLICAEKGMEKFTKGDYSCQEGVDWWEKNKQYWSDVRAIWDEVLSKNTNGIHLQEEVDKKHLFEQLFELGDKYNKVEDYNSTEAKIEIRKIIQSFIIKN